MERIGVDLDLDPFAAAGDDRKYGIAGGRDPHVVLKLGPCASRQRLPP